MSKAKDFQQATAERIIEIFNSGRKRVLLSDEVGLGKTIIARTVTEMAGELPNVKDDGIYRIVYVCSNQNIIRQNTRNLGVTKEETIPIEESRLSMVHLVLQKKINEQARQGGNHFPRQLIPITPGTSFNTSLGAGNIHERALMYVFLREMSPFVEHKAKLSMLLMKVKPETWEYWVHRYNTSVNMCGSEYKERIKSMVSAHKMFQQCVTDIAKHIHDNSNNLPVYIIGSLRNIFAQVSLDLLEPDLVIMDEFQRFSSLLSPAKNTNNTEESMVARKFFSNDHPYILLLSATPYKPFTTLEELNEDKYDEQYEDFLKLMRFLFNNEHNAPDSFRTLWEDYSTRLSQISSDNFDALIISKQRAQDKMYKAICRTERYSEGLIKYTPLTTMAITGDDILAYCQMQTLLDKASKKKGSHACLPIEYTKSAPYLLSFMTKYKEWKVIENAFKGNDVPIVKNSHSQRLLLKYSRIYRYQKIEPANARLEAIRDMLFKNHAERLLWVPASNPYYQVPAGNVFARNSDFSKVLIFSAWEMVPRMLAVMLSYEAERLNVATAYKGITYTDEDEEDAGAKKRKKSSVGKNLLREEIRDLIEYPSTYLAARYDRSQYFGQNINDIVRDIEAEITRDIEATGVSVSNNSGARQLLSLIRRLEGEEIEVGNIPENAANTLAYMAIASPAVCLLRIFSAATPPQDDKQYNAADTAREIARQIIAIFNKRESSAAVTLTITDTGLEYYERVLHYCAMGNLQAVLDEYCHMIDEEGRAYLLKEKLEDSFITIATHRIHTTNSFCKSSGKPLHMRRSFACDYSKIAKDKDNDRNGTLQQAFNSPFRPFVLATTSVGQEGLDFHWYARKIVHWNLPSNAVDLEQREGRINRYKCLAIRRNIAKFFGRDRYYSWNEMFARADVHWRQKAEADYSQLVPYWCLPTEVIRDNKEELEFIERIVPLFPMSTDVNRYERLIDVLSLYRLTMGQPRQEELLHLLEGKVNEAQIRQLLFDLSPYNHNKKQV